MTEGDTGEDLYIIKSGQARVTIHGKWVRDQYPGENFGERALLFDEPRSATITAVYPLTALTINRDVLEAVIGNLQHVLFRNIMEQAIKNSPIFNSFSDEQKDKIVQAVAIRDYPPNTDIFADEPNHDVRYIMVLEGNAIVKPLPIAVRSSKSDAKHPYQIKHNLAPNELYTDETYLDRGKAYGDFYVQNQQLRFSHQVKTKDATKLALLTARAFVVCLGTDQYSTVMESNHKRDVMKKIFLFQFIRPSELETLIDAFRTKTYKQGEYIITAGDRGEEFFIIKEGEVEFWIPDSSGALQPLRTSGKSAYFGERSLILDEPRTASVKVTSASCACWWINREAISGVLEGHMLEHLLDRMAMQDIKIMFRELLPVRNCGRGGYGLVQLVKLKDEAKAKVSKGRNRFALKRLNKVSIVENNMITHTVNEMDIMKNLDHPFVIKQIKTWTDDRYLYFLQELVTGGELTNAIEKMWDVHAGTEALIDCARFYLGSLVVAIEYIHQQNVVYRDLKPENVLLDNFGYIKVIDFGCAKKMTGSRTFTVAGTPHYMAPDVIIGGGYSYPCDIWTLGIMLYDMICGYLPLGLDAIGALGSDAETEDAEESQMKVYQLVLQGKLQFPNDNPNGVVNPRNYWEDDSEEVDQKEKSQYIYHKNADAQNLCTKLLSRMCDMRIGCGFRGMKDIKNHSFFENFDWDALPTRKMSPPFKSNEETYQADEWDDDELVKVEEEHADVVNDEVKDNYKIIHGVEYPEGWDSGFTNIATEEEEKVKRAKQDKENTEPSSNVI
eukprot:GHVH01007338.1.p1 GENE.GHVH01007338.1~~GHVH01007338.1.p1  ORF type:complete len:782 (+),score=176.85 GHVH01007338.1:723-3068(+)